MRERKAEKKRIPMSAPRQKMQVPDMPGFHLHWFNDEGGRLEQAEAGGYEFVYAKEVELNRVGATPANSDLGSKVSMVVGTSQHSQPMRAYLMKIKQEWFLEDHKILDERNDLTDQAIRAGKIGLENEDRGDRNRRYGHQSYRTNLRPDPRRQ